MFCPKSREGYRGRRIEKIISELIGVESKVVETYPNRRGEMKWFPSRFARYPLSTRIKLVEWTLAYAFHIEVMDVYFGASCFSSLKLICSYRLELKGRLS